MIDDLLDPLGPYAPDVVRLVERVVNLVNHLWKENRQELVTALGLGSLALARAAAVTIRSGNSGLRFHCGRAGRTVGPGLHLLVPFLQRIRQLPTRARTLDLEPQVVTTIDGLVYHVEANLVYRVVDMRRALIQIHDLEHGMRQMGTLAIQELLRVRDASGLRDREHLDEELRQTLERRLEAWGVEVERADFASITPSDRTLRLTQLRHRVAAREQSLRVLTATTTLRTGLAILGTRTDYRRRGQRLRHLEAVSRQERRVVCRLVRRGVSRVAIARAHRALVTGQAPAVVLTVADRKTAESRSSDDGE